jgi:ABC-2 type transport system ATP-binding protein
VSSTARAGTCVEAAGLTRTFGKTVRAVDGIDLHVPYGEIYGFLGPNGAGKSTTVHLLTTLLRPTAGRALVAGYDVSAQPGLVRRSIGVAMQEVALDPVLSGHEHVLLQGALHGLSRADRVRRGEQLLGEFGLSGAAGRKVGTYSGGMKRRLDLVLALLHRPSVLFLDEPTNGLDVASREALWEQVRRLASEDGVGIFLTTQYLEEADTLADRIGIIDQGRIVAEASPAQLKAEIGRPTIEVSAAVPADQVAVAATLARFGEPVAGSAGAVAVRVADATAGLVEIMRALDAIGLAVDHVAVRQPSLNDVFLAKTGRSLEGTGDVAERVSA